MEILYPIPMYYHRLKDFFFLNVWNYEIQVKSWHMAMLQMLADVKSLMKRGKFKNRLGG